MFLSLDGFYAGYDNDSKYYKPILMYCRSSRPIKIKTCLLDAANLFRNFLGLAFLKHRYDSVDIFSIVPTQNHLKLGSDLPEDRQNRAGKFWMERDGNARYGIFCKGLLSSSKNYQFH